MQLLPVAAAADVAATGAAAAPFTTLLTSGFLVSVQSVLRTVTGTKLLCCALIDFFRVFDQNPKVFPYTKKKIYNFTIAIKGICENLV